MTTNNERDQIFHRLGLRFGVLPEEIEEAMSYRPTFQELAVIQGLSKLTFYAQNNSSEHRLQAAIVGDIMLISLKQGGKESVWVDLDKLKTIQKIFILALVKEQKELPLSYVLDSAKENDALLRTDDYSWHQLITQTEATKTIPDVLVQFLQTLATIPQDMKELEITLGDLVFVCENTIPDFKQQPNQHREVNHERRNIDVSQIERGISS